MDELLRYESPVQNTARWAAEKTEICGVPVARGGFVQVIIGAANRDPAVFGDTAEQLDVARPNAREHLAFSAGPHYCIGASLARAEGRIGLRALVARFPALGEISGDWGGGATLGSLALWHAARAEDGRGPETVLRSAVPSMLGLESVREVTEGVHFGGISSSDVLSLAPLLLALAEDGDPVAASVVDRQAEEVVLLAGVALSRLGLQDAAVPVVLGGSVLAARSPRLEAGIRAGLAVRAPLALPVWVSAPPVLGAALLALEHAGAEPSALDRLTQEFVTVAAAL